VPLVQRYDVTPPERPVLVIALEGWIDAGFAAATAANVLLEQIETERYATFSLDELIDQRSRRPRLRIDDGVRAELTWSEPEILIGRDARGAGIALLVGPEPDYRWRAFAASVAELARELEVRLVVGLGGFPTATPHTRPVRLASTASNDLLASRVGFIPGSIDVPAGIGDVIGLDCSSSGIPSVGLWAKVPHYVAGMAFSPAALALIDGLVLVSDLTVDSSELRKDADAARRRVDDLIAQSSEHLAMVLKLEQQFDEGPSVEISDDELPSGDEIAAELERYLRGENE
jgi:proteasome assembly chaperone (PAC2) family protein